MTAEQDAEAEALRVALKSAPKDAKPAFAALLKLFNRLGGNVRRLSAFALDMDQKNRERNTRINALEARIARLEAARAEGHGEVIDAEIGDGLGGA